MTEPSNSKSKKMCLIGASGVGKTSLVKQFVDGKFDETYRTTIGSRIYNKGVSCDEEHIKLIIWDLEGKDDPRSKFFATSLNKAEGYMLVADVTRPDTLDVVKGLFSAIERQRKEERVQKEDSPAGTGCLPCVLLINKQDLLQSPMVTNRASEVFGDGAKIFETSAKTGEKVNKAFECLARQMLEVDKTNRK